MRMFLMLPIVSLMLPSITQAGLLVDTCVVPKSIKKGVFVKAVDNAATGTIIEIDKKACWIRLAYGGGGGDGAVYTFLVNLDTVTAFIVKEPRRSEKETLKRIQALGVEIEKLSRKNK